VAGEKRTLKPLPLRLTDNPDELLTNPKLLADFVYAVSLQFQNVIETDLTASDGVRLVGTDIRHADTSAIADKTFAGAIVISTITFDGFGHVQTVTTRTLTPANIGAESAFTKNTAFNKNFGTSAGTVQQGDAGLGSIAGLTTTVDKMIYTTASDNYVTTTLTAFARTLIDDVTATAARSTLGLVIGTNVQAFADGLQSISGLTTLADRMIYTTASDTYAVTTFTAFARTLLDDADADAARTTLGLGTIAVKDTGATGAFTTVDLKTVTVVDGIITAIV